MVVRVEPSGRIVVPSFLDKGFTGAVEGGIYGGREEAKMDVGCNWVRGAVGGVGRDWE